MVNIEALVDSQISLLREKDVGFRRRLTELRQDYGGGARLAAELDELEATDRAFANRVVVYDWQAFVVAQTERLTQAFLGALPVADGSGRIVLYFDLERAEIGVRGRGAIQGGARARLFGRREVVLDLASVFDELVGGGQHTSSVYPIVFSHDAERNRRLVVAAVMIALLWPVLVEFAQGAVGGVRFGAYRGLVFEVVGNSSGDVLEELVFEDGAALDAREVSAVQLGFGGEREIVRQLDAYVEVDAEAYYRSFVKTREVGAVERRDFVEPFGQMRSVRLRRGRCEIEILSRARPILTIKRAVRLLDSAPVEHRVEHFGDEVALDAGYLEIVEGFITEGFRQVYEDVRDESGAIMVESGNSLLWEATVD